MFFCLHLILSCAGRVKKADSLFHTSSRRKRADDESETFKPIFLSDLVEEAKANDTEFYNEVLDTCGSNTECQYDSLATKDAELGASSKVSQEVLQSDQKSISESCTISTIVPRHSTPTLHNYMSDYPCNCNTKNCNHLATVEQKIGMFS